MPEFKRDGRQAKVVNGEKIPTKDVPESTEKVGDVGGRDDNDSSG